jgi:hypothetical protein
LRHHKYSENSQNLEKILGEILDLEKSNKVSGAHDKIIWSISETRNFGV